MLTGHSKLNLSPRLSPYAYQLHAVDAVKDLEYAALFHEQGLGKTKIALDLGLAWLKAEAIDTVLVVTKKGLVRNWEREIKTHTNLSYAVLDGNRVNNSAKFNRPYRLYLTHYEAISGSLSKFSLLLEARYVGVILDEAHHMKNPESRIASAFFDLAPLFKRRVIMTGTPVANRPYDIWSQVYFLDRGKALGNNFKDFKSQYDLPSRVIDNPDDQYEEDLGKIYRAIQSFTVRETKQSAGIELPAKHLRNCVVAMEPQQAELYHRYKTEIRVKVLRDKQFFYDDVGNLLKEMLRLVQVASNPALVDEGYNGRPCKLDALEEVLSGMGEGEKAVIWTSFISNADYLARHLAARGSLKIHGKLDMESRNRAVERFLNDKSKRFLIATPGAAKEGLTLTVANRAVFFDRSFSLNDWLQAQDRIHRISQKQECWVTHLCAEDSIDEWVDKLLLCKRRFAMIAQGDTLAEVDDKTLSLESDKEISSIVEEVLDL